MGTDAAGAVAYRPPAWPARARPEAVLALIGAGAVAVLVLWWHGTPSLHGFGDWLTNAGRITGLEAGYGVEFADFDNPSTKYLRWRLAQR